MSRLQLKGDADRIDADTGNRLPLYRRPCCIERVSAVVRVVGVVLAAGALVAVGADPLRGDDACAQPESDELACSMVGAGTGLNGHDAAGRRLRAPGQKLVARQRAAHKDLARAVNGVHLDHALGQIDPYANGTCRRASIRATMGYRLLHANAS